MQVATIQQAILSGTPLPGSLPHYIVSLRILPATPLVLTDDAAPGQLTVEPINDLGDAVSGHTGFVWSSSDELVATVDSDGLVTPVDVGDAIITVEYAGLSQSRAVSVQSPLPAVDSITADVGALGLLEAESSQITFEVLDSLGNSMPNEGITVETESGNESTIDLTLNGKVVTVLGVADGTDSVRAVSVSDPLVFTDWIPVTVTDVPSGGMVWEKYRPVGYADIYESDYSSLPATNSGWPAGSHGVTVGYTNVSTGINEGRLKVVSDPTCPHGGPTALRIRFKADMYPTSPAGFTNNGLGNFDANNAWIDKFEDVLDGTADEWSTPSVFDPLTKAWDTNAGVAAGSTLIIDAGAARFVSGARMYLGPGTPSAVRYSISKADSPAGPWTTMVAAWTPTVANGLNRVRVAKAPEYTQDTGDARYWKLETLDPGAAGCDVMGFALVVGAKVGVGPINMQQWIGTTGITKNRRDNLYICEAIYFEPDEDGKWWYGPTNTKGPFIGVGQNPGAGGAGNQIIETAIGNGGANGEGNHLVAISLRHHQQGPPNTGWVSHGVLVAKSSDFGFSGCHKVGMWHIIEREYHVNDAGVQNGYVSIHIQREDGFDAEIMLITDWVYRTVANPYAFWNYQKMYQFGGTGQANAPEHPVQIRIGHTTIAALGNAGP